MYPVAGSNEIQAWCNDSEWFFILALMKFLVLRFSSIGDIVLTSPVLRCLRKKFPQAEIHFATKQAFFPVVQHNPYINKVHFLGESFLQLVSQLREEKFDFVIDLHNNQRTFLLKQALCTKSSAFYKANFEKWLMVNWKINHLPEVHIVDRYLKTCRQLGVENDEEGLDYFLAPTDKVDLTTLPFDCSTGYLAWVIGAKQNTKKLPVAKIVEVLRHIQQPVVLLGSQEDAEDAKEIIRSVGAEKLLYHAAGKLSLNQSASLVEQASAVLSNDTGLMHIAAAFKKPLVSFWGNTIPAFGMWPYYGKHPVSHWMLEINGLACRPCSKLGYERCPQKHFNCMNLLEEKKIVEAAQLAMSSHYK